MARQLMQHLQLAVPGLQVPGLPLSGGGHQRATQDRDHFPLPHREWVMVQEGDAGLQQEGRIQGRWRGLASQRSKTSM